MKIRPTNTNVLVRLDKPPIAETEDARRIQRGTVEAPEGNSHDITKGTRVLVRVDKGDLVDGENLILVHWSSVAGIITEDT